MVNSLGERLKEIRTRFNFSQREFAQKIGISYVSLCRYETDKREPPISLLSSIIRVVNISPYWFLTGEGNMIQEETENHRAINIEDMPKEQIKQWLDDFWSHASQEERHWLKIEMGKKFPEFIDWQKKIADSKTESERRIEKIA